MQYISNLKYCIFLQIKSLSPLSGGKPFLICTCLLIKSQMLSISIWMSYTTNFSSGFDLCTSCIHFSFIKLTYFSDPYQINYLVIMSTFDHIYPCIPCIISPRSPCRSQYFSTTITSDFFASYHIALTRYKLRYYSDVP